MLLSGKRMRVDDDEMQEYEISEAEVTIAVHSMLDLGGTRDISLCDTQGCSAIGKAEVLQ